MAITSFRDSIAWQRAMELTLAVYQATRCFPKEEAFGLTSQLRRASVSVASNIAEGQGRTSSGEFLHFLGMARGSALEVQTQLEIASRLGIGNPEELQGAMNLAAETVLIMNSIIGSLRAKLRKKS